MVMLACLFLALIAGLAVSGDLPVAVPALYLAASLTAFVLYRADKTAAVSGGRRTPEDTLLVVGLLGGWPGALVAQRLVHHKSRKASFQLLFWMTVVVNCAVLAWFWSVQR
ncbi:MAG: DUF1294 domain-containing protein [Vicinamibacterales bacterium]